MTPRLILDTKTQATSAEILASLKRVWNPTFPSPGAPPVKDEILFIVLAQWSIETGGGGSMHCWNIGNIKGEIGGGNGCSWTLFSCNEFVKPEVAAALHRDAEPRTDGESGLDVTYGNMKPNHEGKIEIFLHPSHPGSCFRAYDTLDEGTTDYLRFLHDKYSNAWPALLVGDPARFSRELKNRGYYTATEPAYTHALVERYNAFKAQAGPSKTDMLKVLGYTGPKAVQQFQKVYGLGEDNILGPITSKKLVEVYDEKTRKDDPQ